MSGWIAFGILVALVVGFIAYAVYWVLKNPPPI